jgi:Spy/CpxP family protein refolding chaperone
MEGGFGGFGMNPRMLERMADELGLSDAQRQKIRGYLEAARPAMQQLRERGRKSAERLRSTRPGDKGYDAVVAETARDAGEIASQMVRDASKLRAQVWAEFTPEQRSKAEAMQARMRERMDEMRKRRDERRDGGRGPGGMRGYDGPPPPPPPKP